ncbi:MAG: ABC transporter ATP-binding protein [Bacteroidales bacterium]|jgi:ATP-binding cassette subfamily B protein IrtB|nr:ABC transporter ATP-binding protein/permease [Bacteroidales bacterium]MDD2263865.1 ABC transporter ATP-binding protein [Bacteroidales bacterium]MDD2830918.1 ABC transporter ATP-binding protein [Bacteroidales bacterium]MDD3208274.1 ABC transporter ATP-binding protein [Bacteroidales bacterium]MDD3696684.1 ABC transporter ATP-binding protein [Bacteroidales bacterium]
MDYLKSLALSEKGAKDFVKGTICTVLLDISLMLPAVFVFLFLEEYLNKVIGTSAPVNRGFWFYVLLGAGFMLVIFLIALVQYKNTYITIYEESANRRISLAEKLRKLPLAFFGEKNLSDLTSTIMNDNTDLEHTFSHAVPQLFASVISITIIATGLFIYNWQLSLALLWVVPVSVTILLFAKKRIDRENRYGYQIKRDVSEKIQEGLDTIQEIKTYNQEDTYIDELNQTIEAYEKQLIRGELLTGVFVNVSASFLKLGLAGVILVGANLVFSGSVNLFQYLVFLMISASIYNPVNEVFNNLVALLYLNVRIKRMNEMQAMPAQQGNTEFRPPNYDIEFRHVDFSYEAGKKVLEDVSFTARQGEITALVGPSGGGKSTSAKLAARFWDIDKGKITLGGQDISDIEPETLLQYYSVVFQDVVLFNTTILDNIRLGKRDATDEEIIHAAKLAQCDEFVSKMPEGYNSVIGENGDTLSGGERQRISIARALLKDAPVVLLDEATASVDVENETKIQAGISELVKNKTVLIIAHRMRTVANADQVIVLENGKVTEAGSPEVLRRQAGVFAHMVKNIPHSTQNNST